MSGERCERCDKPIGDSGRATALPIFDEWRAWIARPRDAATGPRRVAWSEVIAAVRADQPGMHTDYTCEAVDWRSRCLAAERDRDEAVARAERAEAECGAMRAVVEAAFDMFDTGVSVSFSGDDQARAVRSFEAAVDEWRRTRQSKEGTCTYPPGVAAPPPCEHTHSSRVASSLTFYHGDRWPSRCNGCANLRRFRLSDEVAPYTRREQARIVESLLASNVSLEGML